MKYRGYNAKIEFDDEDRIFTGRIVGINDVVTFHADSVEGLEKAFQESVDDYLDACARLGQQPNKPCSGRLLLRLPPELHAVITASAEMSGVSVNRWVVEAIEHRAEVA